MTIITTLLKINLKFVYFFLKLLPTKNKIVFISRQSDNISLDFQLLIKELDKKYKTVVITKKINKSFFSYISFYFNFYVQMYHLATSKVCVVDSYCIPVSILNHKKTLTVIQIWHALGAIKKFGYQTLDKKDGRGSKLAKLMCMHKHYDYVLSGSKEMIKYFSEAFNVEKEKFIVNGLPRIDYLIENETILMNKIKKSYPKLKEKKNILYVPTFRNNGTINIDELVKEIDFNKYNLIVKLHQNTKEKYANQKIMNCPKYSAFELLTVADYVITDYSAISLEALSINKKVLFYLYDYEEYSNNNGLNVDLFKELKPFAFKNAKDLVKSFNSKYNIELINKFKEKYLDQDFGNYTNKILSLIDEKMHKNNVIKDFVKQNVFIRKIARRVLHMISSLKYQYYYLRYKVDDKVILFESYMGKSYACSPKAIYEYMINDKRFKDYKFVWVFKNPDKYKIDNSIIIKHGSKEYYKYLSIAKYWIVNSLIDTGIKKKKNQIYVQCWHGTPLKKLRYDIEHNGSSLNTIKEIRTRNDLDAVKFDYFISPSKYSSEKFISAFNLNKLHKNNIIIEKGYPRNDYLFNYKKNDISKIKKILNIPNDKQVILYAPTFRDNKHKTGIGYVYELNIDFDELRKKIGDKYIVLFRPHYFIANSFDFNKYKGFVYNVSDYDEINELYLISDILITDYSSVFFDFANLNKPIIFYMYDLDEYKNKLRDFYIDLKELPGPIVENQEDLIKTIKNINKKNINYKKFNEKFNYLDDGQASKRVTEVIFFENKNKEIIKK